jgi:hypothetical protein
MKKRLRVWLWATTTVAGVLVIGVVDWLTGYELSFTAFYFAPVSVGAWFLGFGPSVALSVLSALVWFGADIFAGHVYSSPFYAVWNATMRFVSFLAIGWSVSKIRELLDAERRTAETLRRSLSEVKVLETFLPICTQCKKIRNKRGVWQRLEVYFGEHSNTQFSHGFCPECAKKAMAEAGLIDGKTEQDP